MQSPLLAPLDETQSALIQVIARPLVVNDLSDQKGWPTWDFVRRRFAINNDGAEAEKVLALLPTIVVSGRSYGLWWRSDAPAGALRPEERVGLSMAGLSHVLPTGQDGPTRPDLLGICIGIVAEAAKLELKLAESLDWTQVATDRFNLRDRLKGSDPPVEIVGQVLMREFVPIASGTTQFNYEVRFGNGRFEPFSGVLDLNRYLAVAESRSETTEAPMIPASPLSLPVALDYLGLVLSASVEWDREESLLDLPGFEAASSVCLPPRNMAEFNQRCSDLWNIFGRLRVPRAPDEEHRTRGWDPGTGSLNNLQIWLEGRMHEPDARADIASAMQLLRALGRVRQGSQHESQKTRATRSAALRTFGLPEVVTAWPDAWTCILEGCAAAVHAMARAVRRAELVPPAGPQ